MRSFAELGHGLLVLSQSGRETMSTGAIGTGNEIEIRGVGGMQAAFNDATPGFAMGPGGRPLCVYVLYGLALARSER